MSISSVVLDTRYWVCVCVSVTDTLTIYPVMMPLVSCGRGGSQSMNTVVESTTVTLTTGALLGAAIKESVKQRWVTCLTQEYATTCTGGFELLWETNLEV